MHFKSKFPNLKVLYWVSSTSEKILKVYLLENSDCVLKQIQEQINPSITISWNKCLAGIKIAGRDSNLSFMNDTSLMEESEEEQKSSWWGWMRSMKKLS